MLLNSASTETNDDKQHLRLLEIGHYVYSGISALWCLFPCFMIYVSGFLSPDRFPPGKAPPLLFLMFFVGVILLLLVWGIGMAVANLLAGRWLKERRRRVSCIVVAALNCMSVPFGVMLGVFTILVLQRESVKREFDAVAEAPEIESSGFLNLG